MKMKIKNSRKIYGRTVYVTDENAGAGSFLEPPNHASHFYGIVAGVDRGHGYQEYSSVDSKKDYPEIHSQILDFLESKGFDRKTLTKPASEEAMRKWRMYVYAYFKGGGEYKQKAKQLVESRGQTFSEAEYEQASGLWGTIDYPKKLKVPKSVRYV